jgi:hypothetical protein
MTRDPVHGASSHLREKSPLGPCPRSRHSATWLVHRWKHVRVASGNARTRRDAELCRGGGEWQLTCRLCKKAPRCSAFRWQAGARNWSECWPCQTFSQPAFFLAALCPVSIVTRFIRRIPFPAIWLCWIRFAMWQRNGSVQVEPGSDLTDGSDQLMPQLSTIQRCRVSAADRITDAYRVEPRGLLTNERGYAV